MKLTLVLPPGFDDRTPMDTIHGLLTLAHVAWRSTASSPPDTRFRYAFRKLAGGWLVALPHACYQPGPVTLLKLRFPSRP
jgi:hypothetical protein